MGDSPDPLWHEICIANPRKRGVAPIRRFSSPVDQIRNSDYLRRYRDVVMRPSGDTTFISWLSGVGVRVVGFTVFFGFGGHRVAVAQSTVTLTAGPTVVINTAIAGSAPTPATGVSTWDTNGTDKSTNRYLWARLASAPPSGVTVKALLAAPSVDISAGTVTLSTSYQILETNTAPTASPFSITYTVSSTSAVAPQSRAITVYYCIKSISSGTTGCL